MDVLPRPQRAAEVLFHDDAMLEHPLRTNPHAAVAALLVQVASSPRRAPGPGQSWVTRFPDPLVVHFAVTHCVIRVVAALDRAPACCPAVSPALFPTPHATVLPAEPVYHRNHVPALP